MGTSRVSSIRLLRAGGSFLGELLGQLTIRRHQGTGTADDEGDLVVAVAAVGQQGDTPKGREVVLDGTERMIKATRDLHGLVAFEKKTHGLDAMRLSRPDVLLLTSGGDDESLTAQLLDVADDCPHAAVEESIGEVFVAQQAALFLRLATHAEDASASQAGDALADADLEVRLAGVERKKNRGLLALFQGLARRLVCGHHEEANPPEFEWVGEVVRVEREDLLDGLQDGPGDKRRTVGALLDLASKQAVTGLGVEPAIPQTILNGLGTNHRLAPPWKS
jgi:hypothetical protein